MEELKKLLAMANDTSKDEAKKLAEAITNKITSLDKEVQKQELSKLEAIKSRNETKAKLKLIASSVGVSDSGKIVDAIETIKASGNEKESELLKVKDLELENLKKEIQTANEKLETAKQTYSKEILSVALEKDIATILPKYKAKACATAHIIDAIKSIAVFKDNKIAFLNKDGTTMRANGNDAGLEDVVKAMQDKEKQAKESMFFNIDVQPSGAGNTGGGAPAEGDFIP